MYPRHVNPVLFWVVLVLLCISALAELYLLTLTIQAAMLGDVIGGYVHLVAAIILLLPMGGAGYALFRIVR